MLENMLDYIRIALYTSLLLLGFFLFQAWEKDYPPRDAVTAQPDNAATTNFVPTVPVDASTQQAVTPGATQASPASTLPPVQVGKLIMITTDVLQVKIDTKGGDIVETRLLKYPESLGNKTPFVLLNDDANTRYIAESGLLSKQGPDTSESQAIYATAQTEYTLKPEQQDLVVDLNWQKDGITVTKSFTFSRDSYEVNVAYNVANHSSQPWSGNLYTQLMRTNTPPATHSGVINLTTYFGAAVSSPEKPFEKVPFKSMLEKNLNQTIRDGWAAMIQHYFISAWVQPNTAVSTYYSKVMPNGLYTIGMIGSPLNAQPGQTVSTQTKLYTGPAIAKRLEAAAPHLQLTIDFGWFWFIALPIFWVMQKIHDVIGNWGWAIVIVTIIIKLLFYPLSAKSYRSMSLLKKLQPKIEALKERHGDDRQKLTQATLELYRQEKVNPMGGCLPIFIQIPVFIALYWVLVESVELRQAPFILWIKDLSQHDPYYVLPLLMGISMFIQQRLNPPPPDPMQARVMMAMPFLFTVLFASFPAGLMLYWFVNNTLSFLQQWHIMYRLEKEGNAKKAKA